MSQPAARPLALVTGASSGIGRELAKQFAENGFDLIVAAEDVELDDAVEELRGYGVAVAPVSVDLTKRADVERLVAAYRGSGRPLDAAALNAGVGRGGAFLETDLQDEFHIVDLNVRSTVHLAKLVLRDMATRDRGRVLVTSSIASTMPGSFQAVYNASKSFVQSFGLAIRNELKDTGVTVTSLMPGPTDTEFFSRSHMEDTRVAKGPKDDPEDVAQDALDALFAGKASVVAGSFRNRVQTELTTHLPDAVTAPLMSTMTKPQGE